MRLLPSGSGRRWPSLGSKARTTLFKAYPPSFAGERRHSEMAYMRGRWRTYDEAIECLNTLQTPAAVLKERRAAGIRIDKTANKTLEDLLFLMGHDQDDLKKLNIVHVAGTKGKGTTCAYVDSILAQYRPSHGGRPKVGLFTSPHLVSVRERIRINSEPLEDDYFTAYFFKVWDMLESAMAPKPVYFRFLTLLSYHVFLKQKVDVAIYEVGVGGEYDSTNIVDKPAVTGISHLGIDHTYTLGDTIEQIAWHKAGIQKAGVPSFTVQQEAAAEKVVTERSLEKKVKSLRVLGKNPQLRGVDIRPPEDFQYFNASLAIALAGEVLSKIGVLDKNDRQFLVNPEIPLAEKFVKGLEKVIWRGRCEIKKDDQHYITWHLDGAHTPDSMVVVAEWFNEATCQDPPEQERVLIFNQQGERDALDLLEKLFDYIFAFPEGFKFDRVIFCPTVLGGDSAKKDFEDKSLDPDEVATLDLQKKFAQKWSEWDIYDCDILVYPTVSQAIADVRRLARRDQPVSVLVTGSVRLVGAVLSVLEKSPNAL